MEGVSGGREARELFQEILDAFLGHGRAVHLGDDEELLGRAQAGGLMGKGMMGIGTNIRIGIGIRRRYRRRRRRRRSTEQAPEDGYREFVRTVGEE